MRNLTAWGKKALFATFLCCCSLTGFSEETWNFDPAEVAEYAAFFKQPSAIEGKCNAEVMGIDINREGFSWDDMNTWKNAEGVIWRAYSSGYSETVFGVCVNASAPYNGKTSGLTWTTTEGDNKWYPAIAGVANLKGNLSLTNCLATVVHISGTQLETARIQMTNENTDCYLHVRRNLNLKQIDLSGSTGRCRQLEGYRNAFTDANSFVCNNCRQTEFLDWLLNLEDNLYTFSTLPLHPATGAILKSGYKSQWSTRGGLPVGNKNQAGNYEIESNKAIDLSSEYTVHGNTTVYTWKDQEGNTIEPTTSDQGRFSFDNSHAGNTYRCEMTNATYPDMPLNTVWVTVKAKQNAFNFDPEEVKAYAAFFKQPSAIEGKCNAEAIGIDIHREGFSWDDMNTWRNADGNLWVGAEPAADGSGYCVTFFGIAVNSWAPYYGKTSNLKWYPYEDAEEKNQEPVPGAENLKGTFAMENCLVNVLRIQDTQIDTIRLQMNNTANSYMTVRRNLNLKQLDLSGSTGKIRQLEGYRNAFTDTNSFVCNDCPQSEFFDWLLNLEDNLYTFSTLPLHPATGTILTSGYKLQWNARGGLPVGTKNEAGNYTITEGDLIDLSSEYTVHDNTTTYVWKDQEGNTVEPTEATEGKFRFGFAHVGKTYRCEMKNATYPDMTLNTVWITVTEKKELFNFNADEVAEYAAFFKQPSAIEGKCNAEVLGIDINLEGFSWDDMNTWKNSEGVIWRAYSSGYAETVFGVCVNASAPFNGKTSGLTWTTTEGDNKWYPAIAGVANLKGNLTIENCLATVVHISGTQLDTVRLKMTNESTDCYLHVRRNLKLKQLDLSGSTGRCRQLEGYRNAFTDAHSFVCDDCRQTEFLDWLLNLEDNLYTFSTLPLHPATGAILTSGYKLQWNTRGGLPVGTQNEAGEYEVGAGEYIDLSSEYTVHDNTTVYTWKDQEGNTIEPTEATQGRFSFDNSHAGNTYCCEMKNATYPDMTLNTVWVTIIETHPSAIQQTNGAQLKIMPNPADSYIVLEGAEVLKTQIYNLSGSCVKETGAGIQTIDIADLTPGMYLVRVTTAEGNSTTRLMKR